MKLLVIPARGGSKRIPRKNIRPFHGRPIIGWSISAALECGVFDRVVVSTDDHEIGEIAKSLGAEVPFIRPAELSGDMAGTQGVVQHTIAWFANQGSAPTSVCCLYATAPFVMANDLRLGMRMLEESDADFVVPVTSFPYPIERALRVDAHGRVAMISPERATARSQDLSEAFHDAGQFYCGTSTAWMDAVSVFRADTLAMQLPRYRVQDIDTMDDWKQAELLFAAIQDAKAES